MQVRTRDAQPHGKRWAGTIPPAQHPLHNTPCRTQSDFNHKSQANKTTDTKNTSGTNWDINKEVSFLPFRNSGWEKQWNLSPDSSPSEIQFYLSETTCCPSTNQGLAITHSKGLSIIPQPREVNSETKPMGRKDPVQGKLLPTQPHFGLTLPKANVSQMPSKGPERVITNLMELHILANSRHWPIPTHTHRSLLNSDCKGYGARMLKISKALNCLSRCPGTLSTYPQISTKDGGKGKMEEL